jgi:CheY-like chemotaxis protein
MGLNFAESLIFICMSKENRHTILYAEDDLDDLFIVQQAFESYSETITIVHANNGFMALEYLKELQSKGLLPCLIILDMNMPGMDGRETLIRIRQSEEYKDIPVVVFTTSSHKSDKDFAEKWGAEFITKPLVYNELEALAKEFVSKCNFEISNRA